MNRKTRYQGAIIHKDAILLIRHQIHGEELTFWLFPGGGREDGETAEECIAREMREETNLSVKVDRLLLDDPAPDGGVYQRLNTYLCQVIDGSPSPGYEPELEAAEAYSIAEVRWFDMRDEKSWDPLVNRDPITYPQLRRIRKELGYLEDSLQQVT